jgi:hypothetical protein
MSSSRPWLPSGRLHHHTCMHTHTHARALARSLCVCFYHRGTISLVIAFPLTGYSFSFNERLTGNARRIICGTNPIARFAVTTGIR